MTSPSQVLSAMVRSDPGRPRITVYDDLAAPAPSERIELSARVFENWVSKAANALQDEFDCAAGSFIGLDLPPHWRSAYWAVAIWSVGATLVLPGSAGPEAERIDLLITSDPDAAETAASPVVLVTLAALARSASVAVPGAMDEARELSTYPDQFQPWQEPPAAAVALIDAEGGDTAYGELVTPASTRGVRKHLDTTDLGEFLRETLSAWAADGSIVLSRGSVAPEILNQRLVTEGVTTG